MKEQPDCLFAGNITVEQFVALAVKPTGGAKDALASFVLPGKSLYYFKMNKCFLLKKQGFDKLDMERKKKD